MPIPSALVTRFFQLLVNRKFAEAERELERIKQKMHKTEWNRGYFRALYGMMVARKSNNDQYTFLSKLDFNDKKALQNYRKEFRGHVKSKLHGDFDRGFFAAWANCMRVLSKLAMNNSGAKNAMSETSDKAKSQAKIESFLRVKT
jgi:viroplasmin and RNaseH domain-containing protein